MNDFYAIFIFDFCGVIIGIALKTLLKLYLFVSTERTDTSTLLYTILVLELVNWSSQVDLRGGGRYL